MADIEYFYSAHSAFAYIGAQRLREIASAGDHRVVHRPIELREVIAAAGPGAINNLTPHRRAYMNREIERWAAYRGMTIMGRVPTYHHHEINTPNGVLIAAIEAGEDVDALAFTLLQAHWRDDADLADRPTLERLAQQAGMANPTALVAAADAPAIVAIHEANTADAIARGVLGSPTYAAGGEMYYGQDHLELMARGLEEAYPRAWT